LMPQRQLHIGLSHFGSVFVAAKKRTFCLSLLIVPLVKLVVVFFRYCWSDPLKLHKSERSDQSVLRGVRG
jgi:hypothetical protein